MHKFSSYMQDYMNSGLEYLNNIKDLAMHCWKISDQMITINWVQANIKLANPKVVDPSTRFILSSLQTISTSTNFYCL